LQTLGVCDGSRGSRRYAADRAGRDRMVAVARRPDRAPGAVQRGCYPCRRPTGSACPR